VSYGWFVAYIVINLSMSTLMALLMWLFIERPFMVLRD
jgi:peptidoglycan/LPS O-acetylase OafA/YrhL